MNRLYFFFMLIGSLLLSNCDVQPVNPNDPAAANYQYPGVTVSSPVVADFSNGVTVNYHTFSVQVGLERIDNKITVSYAIDGEPFIVVAPNSPITFSQLSEGEHTLTVQLQHSQRQDSSQHTFTFTVQTAGYVPAFTPAEQSAFSVVQGSSFSLPLSVQGAAPLNYTYTRVGTATYLPLQTDTFFIAAFSATDAGSYRFYASNQYGSDSSEIFTLSMIPLGGVTYTAEYEGIAPTDPASYTEGETVTLLEPLSLTADGKTFSGWQQVGSSTVLQPGDQIVMTAGGLSFEAVWDQILYEVSFYDRDTTALYTRSVAHGAAVAAPQIDPRRTGYGFSGWVQSDTAYDFSTPVTADIRLDAAWQINTFTVTFDPANAQEPFSETVEYNTAVTRPQDPQKQDYFFTEWQKEGAAYTFSTPVTASFTLTAAYSQVPKFSLSYDPNGGQNPPATQTDLTEGQQVTVAGGSSMSYPGHTFIEWKDQNQTSFLAGRLLTMPAANVTLTAQWQVNTYMVTFNYDNGDPNTTVQVKYGSTVSAPSPAPTKDNYTFKYWKTAEGAQYLFTSPVTEAFTLIAHYTENSKYTITYDAGGGQNPPAASQAVYVGQNVTIASAGSMSYTGHTFNGWQGNNGQNYTAGQLISMPEGGLVLTAQWEVSCNIALPSVSKTVAGGSTPYGTPYRVTLLHENSGAKIYYTLDSTKPFKDWNVYSGTFQEMSNQTIWVIAEVDECRSEIFEYKL